MIVKWFNSILLFTNQDKEMSWIHYDTYTHTHTLQKLLDPIKILSRSNMLSINSLLIMELEKFMINVIIFEYRYDHLGFPW